MTAIGPPLAIKCFKLQRTDKYRIIGDDAELGWVPDSTKVFDQGVYLDLIAHGSRDKDGRLENIGAVQDVTLRRSSEEAVSKGAFGARTLSTQGTASSSASAI